jgi:hypothetical protein
LEFGEKRQTIETQNVKSGFLPKASLNSFQNEKSAISECWTNL